MGDRGVIECVEVNGDSIYLYTHWTASLLPQAVAAGLQRGSDRWGDESYLTRILFDTLTGLEGSTTGYGIATWCPEDAWRKVVVNHKEQTVQVFEDSNNGWVSENDPLSFAEFVEQQTALAVAELTDRLGS